jgi:hypothetical protein
VALATESRRTNLAVAAVRRSRAHASVVAAALIVAMGLWAALSHAVTIAKSGYRALTTPAFPVAAGDLDPLSYYASTQALVRARDVIPRTARYAVVVGNDLGPSQRVGVALAFKFWLMPRRYTSEVRRAQWVIAYHHPSETLGVPYTTEVGLAPDVNVVEVRTTERR